MFGYYVILLLGFGLSFLLYSKYRIRAPGVIAAPLLAIYILENPAVLALVAGVAAIVYGASQIIYRRYFIYGRRLLMIMCALSVVISAPLIWNFNLDVVVFATILPALFAYNITTNGPMLKSLGALAGEVLLLVLVGLVLI